jgi:phospholipase/lecithinase/hemolysin
MASMFPRRALMAALAGLALAVTTGCGGGGGSGGDSNPAPSASPSLPSAQGAPAPRVFVAGDSLADVGTFGFKATVQSAANPAAGYPVYPEIVARDLGAGSLCSYFSSSDSLVFTTHAGCTDFAVGGAQVVSSVSRGGSALPYSVQYQLEHAVAANGGAWKAGDLVIVDAGANDAAGLATSYRDARASSASSQAIYAALLAQQLDASTIQQALAQPDGGSVAARLYMQEVARTLWTAVKANTLDKGATRVVLLNVPDLSLTPKFRTIANEIATAEGAAAGAAFQAALRQWVVAFNTELAALVAGESRVVLVPYFEDLTAEVANPAAFGLTNATGAVCPPAGDFPACTDAALDASPPAGLAAGWWKTWAFSNEFHPSPRGHELLAASVERTLTRAGWR